MTKSTGQVKARMDAVHVHVGQKVRELRGKMPVGDFAAKNGLNPGALTKLEDGEPTCLGRLQYIADKNGKSVNWFFRNGRKPQSYPEH
jgi:hypothetical protein